ncbi:MAG: dihydrodipicolinate synthase family protein [Thermodesulfobacteriota bacterium]|nr:dihydrodipicolinate synthase family protein [Thermodesulfobacteriota bacterium]
MAVLPPKGLIGALVTPLDDGNNIDQPSLISLLDYTADKLHGVLIGAGDIGEGLVLKNKKRIELIKAGMEAVREKLPLFLSITGNTEDETAENILYVERTKKELNYKGDIFLLDCPLCYHSNMGLPDLYIEFGKITPLPLVLYNNPCIISRLQKHLNRKNIRTNVLKKLSKNGQIMGICHVGKLKRAVNYARAVRERRNFRVYDGNELDFLSMPSLGGVVAQGANLLPEQWRLIVESSINPKEAFKEEGRSFSQLWSTGQGLKSFNKAYIQNPVAIIKFALKLMGKIKSCNVAENTSTITQKQKTEICNLLEDYQLI